MVFPGQDSEELVLSSSFHLLMIARDKSLTAVSITKENHWPFKQVRQRRCPEVPLNMWRFIFFKKVVHYFCTVLDMLMEVPHLLV